MQNPKEISHDITSWIPYISAKDVLIKNTEIISDVF